MKYLTHLALLSLVFMTSCSSEPSSTEDLINKGSASELAQKQEELNTQIRELKSELKAIEDKLSSFKKDANFALVEAMELQPKDFKHYIKVQGEATTDENILIYPEFSGNLKHIYVTEGQTVSKGQKLAKIDDGGLSSQLAEVKAQRDLVKTRFERQKRLWDQNIGSEIQYLESKTAFEQINNAVNQLESQLKKSVIYAPFSGKVDEVITDQGQVVSPGQTPIFRLLNLSQMYVSANVPENYVGSIHKGTQAFIRFGSAGEEFESKVTQVGSNISESNRNFKVRVAIPEGIDFVKPNLIATVKLNDYEAKEAIVIPENILRENAKGEAFTYSLAMENDSIGTAVFNELELGKHYEGEIEILQGLKASDVVVTEGARTVRKDEKVKVLNFQNK
jgi:RND family efflux transporter MFP subunit